MSDSISGRAMVIAFALVAPPVIILCFAVEDTAARLAALAAAGLGVALAWHFSRSLSQRLRELTRFVDHLLDSGSGAPHHRLQPGDDEPGELARSLSRVAPQVQDALGKLRTELSRRDAILASMAEAVLAVDSQLNVTFCNRSFIEAVGDHGAAEGVPLIKIVRDPNLFQALKRAIDSGETVRTRLKLSGPQSRSFDMYTAPLAGSPSQGAIAILHDITPLERLERVKRDFIANVSHEFRTPLATIRGYAETLLDGGLDDEDNRRRFVEIIQANGIRLNNIAADLLTLSELEAGRPEPQPGPISVGDVVSSAVRAIEPAASLRGVQLQRAPIPEVHILGYGIRFEQALLNLLDNAVKFNKPNGEVRVEVRTRQNGPVEIHVSDTGLGIPRQDLSRIFERFYRVDKARSRQVGGTGLGLSIVKHAIEQMNGTIAVESELGKGSRFTITLPQFAGR